MKNLIVLIGVLATSYAFAQNTTYIINRNQTNLFNNVNTSIIAIERQVFMSLPPSTVSVYNNAFRDVNLFTVLPSVSSRDMYPIYSRSQDVMPLFDRRDVNILISNYNINTITPLPTLPTLSVYFQTMPSTGMIITYPWQR